VFVMRPLRTRNLKDIGRIEVWKLSRPGTARGAERRRNMRWERLEGVLRDIDELRDRGEQAVTRGSMATDRLTDDAGGVDDPRSVAVEPGGGDALGAQGKAPLEGGDGTTP
jgi:hypothetical protein